jgi:hypothetical protein
VSVLHLAIECAQCGREAPSDAWELLAWREGGLALEDELDDFWASMILCPDCDAAHQAEEFDSGDPG